MNLTDYLVIAAVLLIVGLAVFYIIKEKKRGRKCIGCPYGSSCPKNGACHCGQPNDFQDPSSS